MSTTAELAKQIKPLVDHQVRFMADHKAADGTYPMTAAENTEFRQREEELATLQERFQIAKTVEANAALSAELSETTSAVGHPTGNPTETRNRASLGELFTRSAEYAGRTSKSGLVAPVDLADTHIRSVISTTAGYAPEVLRNGDYVPMPHMALRVVDLIRTVETNQAAIQYMAQNALVQNAAETAEGSAFPTENSFTAIEVTVPMREIIAWAIVTRTQVEDVAQITSLIDNELVYDLRRRLDNQIINGDGLGVNIAGILAASGLQTQSRSGESLFEGVGKAICKIEVGEDTDATHVLLHPQDYWDMRLIKSSIDTFVYGDPATAGPLTLFGLPIVRTKTLSAGTQLVGDWIQGCYLGINRGTTIDVTNSHADHFTNGKLAVRATMRGALAIRRPGMFCKVVA